MVSDLSSIKEQLDKGRFLPVYLLHGEEPYFMEELLEYIQQKVLNPGQEAFDLTVFYGKDAKPEQVKDAFLRFPLLGQYHLVVVKEAQLLDKIEDLAPYIHSEIQSSILVLEHKYKKLDARKTLYKKILASGCIFESKPLYDHQVESWIKTHIEQRGLKATPEVIQLIGDHLGNDLSKIHQELEKLNLNIQKGDNITIEHVQTYIGINKEYNYFEFQKYLAQRNIPKTLAIGQYFIDNEKSYPLVQLIIMISSFFSKVYKTHALLGRTDKEIMSHLGLSSPYFVKEYRLAASKYDRMKVESILLMLRKADQKSKGFGAISLNNSNLFKEILFGILY